MQFSFEQKMKLEKAENGFEMLLGEIPNATSLPQHHYQQQDNHGHGYSAGKAIGDDPSCYRHVSLWSKGSTSSSLSQDGQSHLRGGFPVYKTHYPNGFRFSMDPEMPDSPVRNKIDGSLINAFGVYEKFGGISIRDEEEDAVKLSRQLPLEQSGNPYGFWYDEHHSVGSNYGNVVMKGPFEDCRNGFSNGYGDCRNGFSNGYGGFQDSGLPSSAILDEEKRLLMLGLQKYHTGNLSVPHVSSHRLNPPSLHLANPIDFRNVQWKQAMEQYLSEEALYNLQLHPEASLGSNCNYGGIQVLNTANVMNRASITDTCFCSQRNGSNSNGDYKPPYSSQMFNGSAAATPNGRAPQSPPSTCDAPSVEAFSCEDSLIIQGKGLNFVRNDGYNRLREHRRSSCNAPGRGNSSKKDLELAEYGHGPRMNYPSLVPSKYNSLQEIKGCIYCLAKDQQGCRFLQQKFDEGTPKDVQMIFSEIIGHVVELMMNSFGNYLIQKLLDVCTEEQRMQVLLVATAEPGQLVKISLNIHGTRVVQKLIETLKTREQIYLVVLALEPGFLHLSQDLNGNHVILSCLRSLSNEDNKFIFNSAAKYCEDIATHRYGCCFLQRCIDHSTGEDRENLVAEISSNGLLLAQDAFGNYVIQHILELRIPLAIRRLISQFEGNYVNLSTQKFSSNVVEKCLIVFGEESRSRIIHELLASSRFEQLLQDQFANYVIKSALIVSKGHLHASLVKAIQPFAAILRTSPYCKRIFSHVPC
ncbi:Pumilio RNA-binding repeat [Cinnamomum micranthum f. kanehirae]|uniref:Pumilio RNA-binding repeat n=1 Tax=Cinnamomum micranthum f. kanehirae TaxID=337451 RepID=A0A443PGJ4_9MAGN|nr:Pumilio RNA-binding repeat [Cinnamomum micranthum f. kanehirae]